MEVTLPEHIVFTGGVAVAIGAVFIVIKKESIEPGHAPGSIVLITLYVPGVVNDKSITPEAGFINTRPVGEEVKVPALAPGGKTGEMLVEY